MIFGFSIKNCYHLFDLENITGQWDCKLNLHFMATSFNPFFKVHFSKKKKRKERKEKQKKRRIFERN